MSFYYPVWENSLEPSQGSVRQYLDNLYSKFQPIEQCRWNEANIDSHFYAGSQDFINRYFNNNATASKNGYYFNLSQQPVNMVTGYQRQHRKSIQYIPGEGGDTQTTDQYNKLMTHVCNTEGIHEIYSRACEQAAITGMVLLQPYLDYTGDDPAQGQMKLKLWEYNSFLIDPYFRNFDASDAQFVWTQEYISKTEADARFPDQADKIAPMSGAPQRYGNFYFLPENYNMARNDLMVLSYVWYKWKRKKKRLYSAQRNQFFDFAGGQEQLDQILYAIPDLETVEVDTMCWKVAVVLNDQLMYQDFNPLGFDGCPFIPVVWNYEPHQNNYDLRSRGLIRTMRSSNYLMNRQIIISHDQKESTINSGWKRKSGAIANEDNIKKTGQGWDVVINEGYEMTDVEKIIPNSVPESDFALVDRMKDMIFATSGVNLESWSAENSPQASSLTVIMKQAANLMVLQKYFDQWDYSLKILGERMLEIVLNNWEASKVSLMIGEEPTPYFYSRIFCKYQTVVEEGLLTATQQYQEYQGWLELNAALGGIIPADKIAEKAPIQGKKELMEILASVQQNQQMSASEQSNIENAYNHAKIQELQAKAVASIARAREDHSRSESNLGLYEERLSMIERNRALSLKEKQAALTSLLENVQKFGEVETFLKQNELQSMNYELMVEEEREKQDVERRSESNKFVQEIMAGVIQSEGQPQMQQPMPPQN